MFTDSPLMTNAVFTLLSHVVFTRVVEIERYYSAFRTGTGLRQKLTEKSRDSMNKINEMLFITLL